MFLKDHLRVLTDNSVLFVASGARATGVSVGFIVAITIAGAAFIAMLIILIVWLVRRRSDRRKPSTDDYQSLFKYNSLVSGADRFFLP